MILPILKFGDPVLQKAADPVTVFDKELEELSKNMVETMYARTLRR
jgi:peptide deformylase